MNEAMTSGGSWKFALVDQRNHGRSAQQNLGPPHTIAAAARDIVRLFQSHKQLAPPEVILGHSMGGECGWRCRRAVLSPDERFSRSI